MIAITIGFAAPSAIQKNKREIVWILYFVYLFSSVVEFQINKCNIYNKTNENVLLINYLK